jgi:hypothetical protein
MEVGAGAEVYREIRIMVGGLAPGTFRKFLIYSKCEKIRYYIMRNGPV